LAFHWKGDKNFAIFIVNADGSGLKKIAEDKDGDCELPVWSADGRKIFFQTNRRHGNWEIWVMNTDGSEQKPFIWN
jgi:Tol biopolymer transport system component